MARDEHILSRAEGRIPNRLLQALCDHPFLSRRQLELYLDIPGRTTRHYLQNLLRRGWIRRVNARQPWMHTRSLFAPTTEGVAELARQAGVSASDYVRQAGLYPARLERLLLMMERVFQLRTLFLWLTSSQPALSGVEGGWQAQVWDVEVTKFFSARNKAIWIPFHGAAIMRQHDDASSRRFENASPFRTMRDDASEGCWAFVVVEFDLRRVPVEKDRERLVQFVAAQDDPRYWGKEKEQHFPILVVIAQDELRLQDYYSVLRSAALARQLPMPRTYLTTLDAMLTLREDNTRSIWYSTVSGRRVPLLFDVQGIPGPVPEQVPWRKMPLSVSSGGRVKVTGDENQVASDAETMSLVTRHSSLATLTLALGPLEKRLLDEIAAHPLLTAKELAMLLQASWRRVKPGLAQLAKLELVETSRDRYLVATKGLRYLAMIAGFGNAVRRYARARGWGKGRKRSPLANHHRGVGSGSHDEYARDDLRHLESSHEETKEGERLRGLGALVRHWEHTREENEFFLRLAAIARRRGHTLTWLSELESRLYYESGNRRHSFLPDGRGTYVTGDERYEFALEIDRSRAARDRFRRKLAEYYACISSNVLRGEGIELLRVLVVTSSWERAETLRQTALALAAELKTEPLPLFITTFDRLRASGTDAPIWLRASRSEERATAALKTYCFECFDAGSGNVKRRA